MSRHKWLMSRSTRTADISLATVVLPAPTAPETTIPLGSFNLAYGSCIALSRVAHHQV
jgi:hypothetical protein